MRSATVCAEGTPEDNHVTPRSRLPEPASSAADSLVGLARYLRP